MLCVHCLKYDVIISTAFFPTAFKVFFIMQLQWNSVLCRQFTVEDGSAVLPLNTSVLGDVTIIVYHARSTFGGKIQGKVSGEKSTEYMLFNKQIFLSIAYRHNKHHLLFLI